uniref:HTH_Tnp_ISL3 domain-containing protein n=1 Tax=Ascaris lumbricoides TaxID=6252 RepID=A0A0M3I1Q1_ASCLU
MLQVVAINELLDVHHKRTQSTAATLFSVSVDSIETRKRCLLASDQDCTQSDRLVGRLVAWLAGWLVGWLVGGWVGGSLRRGESTVTNRSFISTHYALYECTMIKVFVLVRCVIAC